MQPKCPYSHQNHPGYHQSVYFYYKALHYIKQRKAFSFSLALRDVFGRKLHKTVWNSKSTSHTFFRMCSFFSLSLSPCLLMTSFQYCCSVLDSRMLTCLSVLTHAVCIAPERHYCRELHLAEQNNFCYLFQGGVCLCCSWNWRRDVSGWNQYTK